MHRQQTSGCGVSLYTPGVIPEELRDQFGNACELVCVQVPKVYDSCLLRLCLVGDCRQERPAEGIFFDSQLRVPVDCTARRIVNARVVGLVPDSFEVIEKRPVPNDPDRKFIDYTYTLLIKYDIVYEDGSRDEDVELELTRTETVGPLYCPDNPTIIIEHPTDVEDEIIKLEIFARVLDARIIRPAEFCDPLHPCNGAVDPYSDPYDENCCIVFTVGIYNVIKCELVVQLVIPAFGFCPPPAPCEVQPDRSPCEEFNEELPPAFFPPQLNIPITGPGIDC